MSKGSHISIAPRVAVAMLGDYARHRIVAQVRAVAFIVLYLAAFQLLVLKMPLGDVFQTAAGITVVILGLALFLEGLFLGLMPIGERVGLKLPQRAGLAMIIVFGLLLGLGSTLAEPAVASLRVMGGTVNAWEAPLLFQLVENDPGKLLTAIAIGVGIAVAVGMVRLYFGLSIKPFVYVLTPLLLAVSWYCGMDANLASIIGLAWDTGAVTTGPVTVPLVLALGIGVSRAIGKQKGDAGGFGMIMLASAFPVLCVLVLGIVTNTGLPHPMNEQDFFSPEYRQQTLPLFATDTELLRHAYRRGSEVGRRSLHRDEETHRQKVRSLADPEARFAMIGDMPLSTWIRERASEWERTEALALQERFNVADGSTARSMRTVLRQESKAAVRSVIPLTALLLVVLLLFLRDRLRNNDEVFLGIVMSLVGMTLLTSGIRTGLAPMGDGAGSALPRLFPSDSQSESRLRLEPFDPERDVFAVYDANGEKALHFHFQDMDGSLLRERFYPSRYDPGAKRYEHIVRHSPMLPANLTLVGIGMAFLFVFGLGYGSTLAEPALNALGRKVDEITVGTVKQAGVIRAVSIGVGLGLVAGIARIVYGLPTIWLIAPPYLALLWLTYRSEDDFTGIAWDCGGVTTGPVTVPLVMAMGLGVSSKLNVVDGFGALALASVYPIVTVLVYGLVLRMRQRRSIQAEEEDCNA